MKRFIFVLLLGILLLNSCVTNPYDDLYRGWQVHINYPQDNYSHIEVRSLSKRADRDNISLYVDGIRLILSDDTPTDGSKIYHYDLLIENDIMEYEFDLVVNGRSNKVRLEIPHKTIITSHSHGDIIDPREDITMEWEIEKNSQRQTVRLMSLKKIDHGVYETSSYFDFNFPQSQRSYTFPANSVQLYEVVYMSVSNVNNIDSGKVSFISESFDRRQYHFTDTENIGINKE